MTTTGGTASRSYQRLAAIVFGVAAIGAAGAIGVRTLGGAEAGAPSSIAPSSAPGTPPADPAAMIASLEGRLRADPDDGEGWRTLGWAYFRVERYRDAAGAYAKATRLLPNDAAIWSALGEAQTLTVNAVDGTAHDAFTKALAIDRKDARARYFLGVEKDVAGDHKGAVEDWIALLRDSPGDAPFARSVHDLVTQVAAREKIDVAGRLPAIAAPAAPAAPAGEAVASAGIPGPSAEQMGAAAQLSPTQQDEMARGMVDRLAARLARDPRDADGWIRLMRSRTVLGDKAAAARALADARRAFAGDPTTLARLDDAARTVGVPR